MPSSSRFPGSQGALAYPGGVTFRVWAPFAPSVCVAGDFNGFSDTANPLSAEANGYWSTDVPGGIVRQQYHFVVGGVGKRLDPYPCRSSQKMAAVAVNL
jgi:1,4-alpha-glucan branching enzyme